MEKLANIEKDGHIYDVIDTVNFSNTTHVIIQYEEDVLYINKEDNKYYLPPKDLSLEHNDRSLSYLRKQYLLKYLITFINERNIYDKKEIKKVVKNFKDFIKNSNIERFLYWPLLDERDFNEELMIILKDLEYQLEQSFIEMHKKTI